MRSITYYMHITRYCDDLSTYAVTHDGEVFSSGHETTLAAARQAARDEVDSRVLLAIECGYKDVKVRVRIRDLLDD